MALGEYAPKNHRRITASCHWQSTERRQRMFDHDELSFASPLRSAEVEGMTSISCHRCRESSAGKSAGSQLRWFFAFACVLFAAQCTAVNSTNTDVDDRELQSQNVSFRRCFCNLPSCVQTGYMCKSTAGACFAQLSLSIVASDGTGHAHVRYACAENLPSVTDRRACVVTAGDAGRIALRRRAMSTTAPAVKEVDQWAETVCCAMDMCNYYYFRSTGSLNAAELDGETTTVGEKSRSLVSSVDTNSSSVRFSAIAFILIIVCMCLSLLFVAIVAAIIIHVRRVEQRSNRTTWPPTSLLSATTTSASMVEPLYKSSIGFRTTGYIQLHHDPLNACLRCSRYHQHKGTNLTDTCYNRCWCKNCSSNSALIAAANGHGYFRSSSPSKSAHCDSRKVPPSLVGWTADNSAQSPLSSAQEAFQIATDDQFSQRDQSGSDSACSQIGEPLLPGVVQEGPQ